MDNGVYVLPIFARILGFLITALIDILYLSRPVTRLHSTFGHYLDIDR